MRIDTRVLGAVGALAMFAAVFAPAGGAMVKAAASGDTCTATGTGSEYTLHITIPAGSQQYGFAFGASGATVTNADIPGTDGSFSTQNLAPNTTGAWLTRSPVTGSPDATLTLTGSAGGSFTIVPSSAKQTAYLAPVTCKATVVTATPSVTFSVDHTVKYVPALHAWHLSVKAPGAGTISARQLLPTVGTGGAKSVTAKSLVQSRRIVAKSGGTFVLTLRSTPAGVAKLASAGSIKANMSVTFDAANGKSASKQLTLTLRK
jgi:hypothetical protein